LFQGLFGSLKPSNISSTIDDKVSSQVEDELSKQYEMGIHMKGKRSGLGFSD